MNAGDDAPIVEIEQGRLRGFRTGEISIFRGIPYATPPFGAHRFQPPHGATPWKGVKDAKEFSPLPPQVSRQERTVTAGAEACLSVNVWTPSLDPTAALPVMVWIPGGGFLRGGSSEPLYDGTSFARQGVVLVSINYRLGVDGFLQFPDAVANRGLLDQLAALRWVQTNIAAFGGHPGAVTVFGQSAGAGSIACLLAMPESRGLFERVILQSPSVTVQTLDEAMAVTQAVASLLGVEPTATGIARRSVEDSVRALAQVTTDADVRRKFGISAKGFFPVRPVVDGHVLHAPPLEAIRAEWKAQKRRISMVVGSNVEEMRFYLVPDASIDRITECQLRQFAEAVGVPDAIDAYRMHSHAAHPGHLLCSMQSDYYYRVPAWRLATLASAHEQSCYLYEFGWSSPQFEGRLGAAHGVELAFVFNNLPAGVALNFVDSDAPLHLRDAMHNAWTTFAKCGSPGWPPYSSEASGVMHFGLESYYMRAQVRPEAKVWGAVRY